MSADILNLVPFLEKNKKKNTVEKVNEFIKNIKIHIDYINNFRYVYGIRLVEKRMVVGKNNTINGVVSSEPNIIHNGEDDTRIIDCMDELAEHLNEIGSIVKLNEMQYFKSKKKSVNINLVEFNHLHNDQLILNKIQELGGFIGKSETFYEEMKEIAEQQMVNDLRILNY